MSYKAKTFLPIEKEVDRIMQELSKSDEQKLLDGVKQAVALVDQQGLTPNDALQKVAEKFQYSPGFLKSACNAFNTGRQLSQWNEHQSALDKLASFPLADYNAIHDKMWGKTQEKVAEVSVLTPRFKSYADLAKEELLNLDLNNFTKSAAAVELSAADDLHTDEQGGIRVKRAYAALDYHRKLVEESRRQKQAAEDQLNLKLHLLESYFKKFAYDRLPLAQVEHATTLKFGSAGRELINYIAVKFPKEKRACDHSASWRGFSQAVNYNQEPYTLIGEVIKKAKQLNYATTGLKESEAKLAAATDVYTSFIAPLTAPTINSPACLTPSLFESDSQPDSEKVAFLTGKPSSPKPDSKGTPAKPDSKRTPAKPDSKNKLSFKPLNWPVSGTKSLLDLVPETDTSGDVESRVMELDDPQHINDLRAIRAKTILTQMMSDPDSVASGVHPEQVVAAYNDLVQLAPRLSDQPDALKPLLSKRLSGNLEPFEVEQALKIENLLRDTQPVIFGASRTK
jgi:hypothetical protein